MEKIKVKLLFFNFLVFTSLIYAQTTEITGTVVGVGEVENIHVINKTANKFTVTNKLGGFKIEVRINDTLVFTSIRYKLKAVQVKEKHIAEKRVIVLLEENVNQLDKVVVGKVLTGQLDSDVNNADKDRDIDFYDVGIPGYTGKPKTQSERRLYEADAGKMFYLGLGLGVNLNKILNKVTGRTKELKERVRKEYNTVLLDKIRARLSDNFFKTYPLKEELRTDFFYFCSEDENFESRCKGKSDIEVFEFLAEKMAVYKTNLEDAVEKN